MTRVFNDLTDIVEGRLDVFIRDDETDEPLEFALVCVYDENVAPAELLACDLTDDDGQAEFLLGDGFYALTAGHPDYEIQGSGTFFYSTVFDSFLGGGMDDELGDVDPFLGQQDLQLALDPRPAILGVEVLGEDLNGNGGGDLLGNGGTPVSGQEVRVYLADPFDIPGVPGACLSTTLVAVGNTDDSGIVEFNLANDKAYCVSTALFTLAFPIPSQAESPVQAGLYDQGPPATPFEEFDPAGDIDIIFYTVGPIG